MNEIDHQTELPPGPHDLKINFTLELPSDLSDERGFLRYLGRVQRLQNLDDEDSGVLIGTVNVTFAAYDCNIYHDIHEMLDVAAEWYPFTRQFTKSDEFIRPLSVSSQRFCPMTLSREIS
jgi:hypothetical protein